MKMNAIQAAVRKAGKMILDAHVEKQEIHEKVGPANFVTDYDVKIQQFLIEKLSSLLPGVSFFGEEDTNENQRKVGEGYTFFITLDDLAARFFINKYYLAKSFKAQFGATISSYLTTVRITHAKQLLRFTDKTLDEIGEAVGITPARYLSEVFSSVEGVSPSIYRRQW